MPSVSTQPAAASTRSTWLNERTSSRRRASGLRSRNRFEVSLASPTGPAPCLSRAARASFFLECCSCGRLFGLVEEAPAPAARKHVLADEIIGVEIADVADEVDQPQAAGLERAGVRLDQIHQAVASGVLETADRDHLVELPVHAAEVAFDGRGPAQAPPLDLALRVLDLRARGVVAGDLDGEMLLGEEQEAAEAAADVDHVVAGLEQYFLADVLELVALRLFQRARAFLPVGAGVEHQRIVEPEAVELGSERVVKLGVLLGAQPVGVGVQELVQAVGEADEKLRLVGARRHAGSKRARQAALQIDLAGGISLQQPDVAQSADAPVGLRLPGEQRGIRS